MAGEALTRNNMTARRKSTLLGGLDDLARARVGAERATKEENVGLGAVPLVVHPATALLDA
jgi:hypothetical protein